MRPPPQPSNRQFSRHASVRRARLKPAGQSRWIEVALTDWSTAGAGLRGAPDSLSPGPAIVEIDDRLVERGNALRVQWGARPYGDQAIFLRRKLFEAVGGFPDVPLLEDLLLARAFARHCRPVLLSGPVYLSPRHWERRGVVRQTLRNWSLLLAHARGVDPATLKRRYA